MSKPSIFKRAAALAKSLAKSEAKTDQEKRIEFAQQQVVRRVKQKRKNEREADYAFMMQDSGMTRQELDEKLQRFRTLDITTIGVHRYRACGLYLMDDEEALKTIALIKESAELEEDLKRGFKRVGLGEKTIEDMQEGIEEFKALESRLLTPAEKRSIANKAAYLHPEKMDDAEAEELALDMEFSRRILRCNHEGYTAFHFYGKSIAERREFICDEERRRILRKLNSDESNAILDDKLMTYEALSDFYGRDMAAIEGSGDYAKFSEFFSNNSRAVIKPRFESLGKGIRLMEKPDDKDMRSEFGSLVDEYGSFLMEGFIDAADEVRVLNPDSVNTVRVIAWFDGEKTAIQSASMRIGHAGSFVDNVGAGGLTVSVDKETGVIDSDAIDESGFRYETHPETGARFKGCQLPAWDRALEVVRGVSGKIDGAKYVGWDLACTKDHDWVIVEGNGKTGFYGAQAPKDRGVRREFLETIGYDQNGLLYEDVEL